MTTLKENTTSTMDFNQAVKWGAIFAVLEIVLLLIFYLFNTSLLLDWKIKSLLIIVSIIAWIIIGRSAYAGTSGYQQRVIHGLTLFITANIVVTLFNLILYQVIDPYLPEKLADDAVQQTEEVLSQFMSHELLDIELQNVREKIEGKFEILSQLKNLGFAICGSLVIATVCGAINKKSQV